MDHIAPRDEIETVKQIISHHALPEFVKDYNVWLGEFDGTPGVWIEFRVVPHDFRSLDANLARGDALVALTSELDSKIFEEMEDRYPFYQFAEVAKNGAHG